MELLPARPVYKKRVDAVQELYSRIPDPPAGNEPLDECRSLAKCIALGFEDASEWLIIIARATKPAEKGSAADVAYGFLRQGGKLKAALNELEAATAGGRVPKIENFKK